jgi:type IV pilus assembly protein PilM
MVGKGQTMKLTLPFVRHAAKNKREQIIAVDLGSRTTKAVRLLRRDHGFALTGYAILDAPIVEKTISPDMLGDHLKQVNQALGGKIKSLAMTASVNDTMVRPADVPQLPVDELRSVLRLNSRSYLQQDLSTHVFDCQIIPPWYEAEGLEPPKVTGLQKQKVLVAGAKQQLVDELVAGARIGGFVAEHVIPGLLGPINAFELAMPDLFKSQAVVLVDLGFRNSSICILYRGELMLSRVVNIGGDRLTSGLSESMKISYAEAEGIKVGMAHEVASTLEGLLLPLGRELRASIDFFEHQQDKTVNQVFLSGASTQSELIVRALQTELMVDCKPWSALNSFQLDLPAQQTAEIEHVAPQLTVALGVGLAAL